MKFLIFIFSLIVLIAGSFAALKIDTSCPVSEAHNVTRKGKTFLWPDVQRYKVKDTPEGIRFT